MKIKVNEYVLKNPKIKKDLKVLVITDTHGNIEATKSILKIIDNIKIDLILISGDIIDKINQDRQKEFISYIKELAKYANVYATLGNHDFMIRKHTMIEYNNLDNYQVFDEIDKTKNFTIFKNIFDQINIDNNITINSIILPKKYYKRRESKKDFDNCIKDIDNNLKIDNSRFNILLCHSPNSFAFKNKLDNSNETINKIDLIISGHNHGGLVMTQFQDLFKFHYGLFGPYSTIIQRNSYGIISDNNRSLFISNGVTKLSESAPFKFMHKIGNKILKPEIDIINMKNDANHSVKLVNRKVHKV